MQPFLSHVDEPCLNAATTLVESDDDCLNSSRALIATVTANSYYGNFLDVAKVDSDSLVVCSSVGCKDRLDDFLTKCMAPSPVSFLGYESVCVCVYICVHCTVSAKWSVLS